MTDDDNVQVCTPLCRLASSSHSGCSDDILAFILTIEGLGRWPMRVESSLLLGRVLPPSWLVVVSSSLVDSNATSTTIVAFSH